MADVKEECTERYGPLRHIHVPGSSIGDVYLRFESIRAAQLAQQSLHGRFFSGAQIVAVYVDVATYEQRYPSS